MTYAVKELFYTLQGEGCHAGTSAVFIRFAGCNLWSGREQDRARDSSKGCCALWCDTDFRGTDGTLGGTYAAAGLADAALSLWPPGCDRRVAVLTGGEPSLQVDEDLVASLRARGFAVHVETNGTRRLPPVDWVTLSPKPPAAVVDQDYSEVKLVFSPGQDPDLWVDAAPNLLLQPLWDVDPARWAENSRACVEYVMNHPYWRLSVQSHKVLGLR